MIGDHGTAAANRSQGMTQIPSAGLFVLSVLRQRKQQQPQKKQCIETAITDSFLLVDFRSCDRIKIAAGGSRSVGGEG